MFYTYKNKRLESTMEKIARIYSKNFNVNIIQDGSKFSTDGKNIYIPNFNINENFPKHFYIFTEEYILHEIGHLKYTDWNFSEKTYTKLDENLKYMINLLEDIRIENSIAFNNYGIDSKQFDFINYIFNKKDIKNTYFNKEEKDYCLFLKSIYFYYKIKKYNFNKEKFLPILNNKVKKALISFDKEFLNKINDCKNTPDIFKIAKIIFEKYKYLLEKEKPEKPIQELKPILNDENENKGSSADIDKKLNKEENVKKDDNKKDIIEEKIEEDKIINKEEKTSFDIVKDLINDSLEEEKLYSELSNDKYIPHPLCYKNDKIIILKPKNINKNYNIAFYTQNKKIAEKELAYLKSRIRNVLITKSMNRWLLGQSEGKIDFNSIYKIKLHNYKIFKQRYTYTDIDTAIEILFDNSSSMLNNNKLDITIQCLIILSETLTSVNIPHEILGFTSTRSIIDEIKDFYKNKIKCKGTYNNSKYYYTYKNDKNEYLPYTRYNSLITKVVKSFNENLNVCKNRFKEIYEYCAENCDHESILIGAKRLLKRKENRKILLVLSDGLPQNGANCSVDLLNRELKDTIKNIENSKIECVGIGINTKAPKEFYPQNICISNIAEFPVKLFKYLQNILIK